MTFVSTEAAYAVNGQAANADTFYDMASDPRRSVAVEACAGAGKTWMLITRMVRALEAGAAADQVLAITFTKKAAGEMRERLQARLALPEHAALRSRLLADGRSVQILTFHAWFAQLLTAAPLAVLQRLALPLQYELLEDDSVLLPELELAFYAVVGKDTVLKADFAALLAQLGRSKVSDALTGLLAKRVEFELCDQGGFIEASVSSAAQLYPAFADMLNGDACQANTDAAWLDARPEGLAQFGVVARLLGKYATNELKDAATQLEMGLTHHEFQRVQSALLTQQRAPKKYRSKITDVDRLALNQAQTYVLEILAVQHQHDCWLYQQRMTRLGRAWLAAFAQLKRDRGLVDMSDLERAATTLLSDPVLSGAVQERLDLKLRHVMIDEFQDTNPLQWQAMHAWLSSYAGSGGGGHDGQNRPSLFIVGDPKQSIYRFRRAEPRVFLAAQVFMQASFDAVLLSCDHTRRNAPEVVTVVNTVMNTAMNTSMKFRPHTTASDTFGAALCLPLITRTKHESADAPSSSKTQAVGDTLWRDSLSAPRIDADLTLREQEAEQAARWISGHLNDASATPSVMVLSRRHSSLALMQAALQQCGITSDKQEKTFLANVPAVQDVLALLGALVSPHNDLDLARALKSPLFGWSDAQLMTLRTLQLSAQETMPAKPWFDYLPIDLHAQLERWQMWLHHWPAHDALQAIYDEADVLHKYQLAMPIPMRYASLIALQALLWAALQEGGGRYLNAYGFLRALRAKTQTIKAPAAPASAQAVQLLTIHGAKGLEADTVLLLDSDAAARKPQSMTTLVDWLPDQPAPRKFVFLQSESEPPKCAQTLLQDEIGAREIEEINTLYVAMTRARRTLVVSACESYVANPKSVWQRLNLLCDAVEVTAALPTAALKNAPCEPADLTSHSILRGTLSLPVFANTTASQDIAQAVQTTQIGLALHRLLQWLPMVDGANVVRDWPAHERQAVGREFQLTPEALDKTYGMAKAMANGEALWLWDRRQVDWYANEYELMSDGHLLRIDRLVKHQTTQIWWVIDFKSSARPDLSPALCDQLNRYQTAVAQHLGVLPERVKTVFVAGDGNWLVHNSTHF